MMHIHDMWLISCYFPLHTDYITTKVHYLIVNIQKDAEHPWKNPWKPIGYPIRNMIYKNGGWIPHRYFCENPGVNQKNPHVLHQFLSAEALWVVTTMACFLCAASCATCASWRWPGRAQGIASQGAVGHGSCCCCFFKLKKYPLVI